MKITVFTSNQPRHINLIESLALISDQVCAVQECTTVFPGQTADFYQKTPTMNRYFKRVLRAEQKIFGPLKFTAPNVTQLAIRVGDLNQLDLKTLKPALDADLFVVFGASFIKKPLIKILMKKKAINIHMGISPYYRGNSCNFWALYDHHPELVGATIHKLTDGLDSGDILYHSFPIVKKNMDGFTLGMQAVKTAHQSIIDFIKTDQFQTWHGVKQDKSLELRYTRRIDFTDQVANKYLAHLPDHDFIRQACQQRNMSLFVNPQVVK